MEKIKIFKVTGYTFPSEALITLDGYHVQSRCPFREDFNDFGTVTISYIPSDTLLETKSVRKYLDGFQNETMPVEEVACLIYDAVCTALGKEDGILVQVEYGQLKTEQRNGTRHIITLGSLDA